MRRMQTFVVTVEMPSKDDCGNETPPITEGEVRRALLRSLPINGVSVSESTEEKRCDIDIAKLVKMTENLRLELCKFAGHHGEDCGGCPLDDVCNAAVSVWAKLKILDKGQGMLFR